MGRDYDDDAFRAFLGRYNAFNPEQNIGALIVLQQRVGLKAMWPVWIVTMIALMIIPFLPTLGGLAFGGTTPVVYEAGDLPARGKPPSSYLEDGDYVWVLGAGQQITATLSVSRLPGGGFPIGNLERMQGKLVADASKCPSAQLEWALFAGDRRIAWGTALHHELVETVPAHTRNLRLIARRTDSAFCGLPLEFLASIKYNGWL